MRGSIKFTWLLVFLFSGTSIFANGGVENNGENYLDVLDQLISIDANSSVRIADDLNEYLSLIDKKKSRFKKDDQLIEWVFYKTHSRYLKRYTEFSTFNEIFETGTYNCLTATTLYAVLLEHLGYEYEVVENTYHIYLKVVTPDGDFLIESTDPIGGFIDEEAEKTSRIAYYRLLENEGVGPVSGVNNTVSLEEMVGLHYYNRSIDFYNKKNISMAYQTMNKAVRYYNSPRMKEFIGMILDASNLSIQEKVIIQDALAAL